VGGLVYKDRRDGLSDRKILFRSDWAGSFASSFLLHALFSILRLGFLLLCAASGCIYGAATEMDLEVARLKFERAMVEASLTPLKNHLIELSTLEKQRAEARDYTGAIALRQERRKVEDELERLDKELLLLQTREQSLKATTLPDKIPFPVDQAQLSGVRREGGGITGWSKVGASASWKLPDLPPGGYEVIIRYRCRALEGGVLEVKEVKFRLSGQIDTTLKGPQEKSLGTLKVTNGSSTLTLTATTLVKDNLMDLLGLWLVPASR